jgi:hypothetical protein
MDLLYGFYGDNRPFVPVLVLGPESSCLNDPIRRSPREEKDLVPLIG